ncbi:MAG TPA: alpha-hydroxy acid oxidase [Azonexus sp.]
MSDGPLPPLERIPADVVAAVDYERVARRHLDDNAWAYLQGGAADELSVDENAAAFRRLRLLPQPLIAVAGGHTRLELFDETYAHPIVVAPVAYQRLFHPQGELATVQGAGALDAAMTVSTLATTALETIADWARGPLWFQLYWQGGREASLALLRRAEAAGYRVLVLTVDAAVAGVRNREQRAGFRLPAGLAAVNVDPAWAALPVGQNVFAGPMAWAPTWDDVAWLVRQSRLPVVLKGLLHPLDARRAVDAGVHGIVVSNHGGRTLDTAAAPLEVIGAMRTVVGAGYPLLLDGGIRRGTDVFKAIALGATAVMVGRPYIHALATAGALGVAHLLRLLREELEVTMALCGCRSLAEISDAHLLNPPE